MSASSQDKFFIGGEWVSPRSAATIAVHHASTGERAGTVPEARGQEIGRLVPMPNGMPPVPRR